VNTETETALVSVRSPKIAPAYAAGYAVGHADQHDVDAQPTAEHADQPALGAWLAGWEMGAIDADRGLTADVARHGDRLILA
jgi:hypothetical protein